MIEKVLRQIMQQLLLMFCIIKRKKIYCDYVSKPYLAVEKLVTLLREITWKNNGDSCLNCYENSKQLRTSTKCIQLFIRHWLYRCSESLQKMYCETIFFFSFDATIASDNPSRFRKNLLEKI